MPSGRSNRIRGGGVTVEGLDDFRRELRKLDEPGLMDELKGVNYEIASLAVAHAKTKAAMVGRMQAKAAESLTPSRSAQGAFVAGGGANAPFFGGAEFGAGHNMIRYTTRGAMRGWNQFEHWRGNGMTAGYFLFPAIRDDEDDFIERYGDAIERITKRAFPD